MMTTPSTTEEWENAFDKEWPHQKELYNTQSGWLIKADPVRVKSFIRTLLTSQEAAVRREEIEKVIKIAEERVKELAEEIRMQELTKPLADAHTYTRFFEARRFADLITNLRESTD